MKISQALRSAFRITVVVSIFLIPTQSASAQNYSIHFDGGGETIIDTPQAPQIFTEYSTATTQGEKLAAIIDYIDAASSARKMFSASAGGLYIGNLKR